MSDHPKRAVVIGASAGAVQALTEILSSLPAEFSLPILIVVHVPANRQSILAPLFEEKSALKVREAEDKEPTAGGVVYFAPAGYHLLVEADGSLSLSSDEEVLYSRPSIDVLFESAADAYGPALVGVILTGANSDGARGLKAIADAGGVALVQEPSTAYSDAMPRAALKECVSARTMTLASIASYLMEVGKA